MIIFVAAHAKNYAMGKDGHLPWEGMLEADKERLHSLCRGKTVVVGERTYREYKNIQESFHSDQIIVVSRSDTSLADASVVSDMSELVKRGEHEDLYVIGGASIFAQLFSHAIKMHLTRVEDEFKADVFFPTYSLDDWKVVENETHGADDKNTYNYTFLTLKKM